MKHQTIRQRLKWAVAILCVLLSPIVGMVLSVCTFWRGSLTNGIALGGVIGVALYFCILWRELKLKEQWVALALSVLITLLFVYLLVRRHTPEMTVLALIYIPVCVTLMPFLHTLDQKPVSAAQKPSRISTRMWVVALTLLAVVLFCAGRRYPVIRPLANTFLQLYAAAVLVAGMVFFVRVLFKRVANSPWQKANCAYQQQCNPRPMLAECERRLSKRLSKTVRQRWLVQKASALAELGEPENAICIINGLLSSEQDIPVQTRWACFYDLADFHCSLGNPEAAADNRAKAYACAQQCKSLKTKQWMLDILHSQEGVLLYCVGEYESAKQRMLECGWDSEDTPQTQTLCTRVFHAYRIGMAFLKTGDTERAMEKLRFVAEYGNQLAVTAQAKEAML